MYNMPLLNNIYIEEILPIAKKVVLKYSKLLIYSLHTGIQLNNPFNTLT